jgi:putative endonuclease
MRGIVPGMGPRGLFVYIVASLTRRLYIGVTGDLVRRLRAHHAGIFPGHGRDHRITRLVYYERVSPPSAATTREQQIKRWTRAKRIALIESANPDWLDLAADWLGADRPPCHEESRKSS